MWQMFPFFRIFCSAGLFWGRELEPISQQVYLVFLMIGTSLKRPSSIKEEEKKVPF